MTIEHVAEWLFENRCPMTLIALHFEWKNIHHKTHTPLVDFALRTLSLQEKSTFSTEHAVENILEQAMVDMIIAYGKINEDNDDNNNSGGGGGEGAIRRVFNRALMEIATPSFVKKNNNKLEQKEFNNFSDNNNSDNFFFGKNSDKIYDNSDGGDNNKNNNNNNNNVSCSGRVAEEKKNEEEEEEENNNNNKMLYLLQTKLKQTEENLLITINTLSEQLPILINIVDPMRKDVLIPIISLTATLAETKSTKADARFKLLTLYNRPNREHRAAVAQAWALMLKDAPQFVLEHDIVPELYILANAKYTERRVLALECVACLAPVLENGYFYSLRSVFCQSFLRQLCEDETQTVRFHVVRCLVELWPKVGNNNNNNENEKDKNIYICSEGKTAGKEDECVLCFVELFVHIILHDSSSKVRSCALQSLRDCLCEPKFTSQHLLLKRIIPLLLSFVERESAVLNCANKPAISGGEEKDEDYYIYLSLTVDKENSVEKSVSRNILILAKLIEVSLCSAWKTFTTDTQNDSCVSFDSVAFDAYLCVVLPSAYAFVLVSQEEDVLTASICAVATSLASVVSMFNRDKWQRVRNSLETFVTKNNSFLNNEMGVSCAAGWRRRQLCFFFTFLMYVCGGKSHDEDNSLGDFNGIADDAALLLGTTLAVDVKEKLKKKTELEKEKERNKLSTMGLATSVSFNACASCLIWFLTRVDDAQCKAAAAVSSVLSFFTESTCVEHQMIAIALVERVSRFAKNDEMRKIHIWPALLALMNHTRYEIKEAAVKAALSMVKYISNPMAQENVMKTALAIVETEGCPSRLGVDILRHWSSLLREMPAEPREMFLYPQLAAMIEELSGLLLLLQREPEGNVFTTVILPGKGACKSRPVSKAVANEALDAIISLLAAIPHCAVVTPQLVKKHLVPAIRLLTSIPSLPAASRTQLLAIEKEYDELLKSSKGLGGTFDLFDRILVRRKK